MQIIILLLSILTVPVLILNTNDCYAEEILLDAVVASVNGKPITLDDISKYLTPARKLSLEQARQDPQVRNILESLVTEELIRQEAKSKNIEVSKADIDSYMNELAQKNGLDRAALEHALLKEVPSIEQYKKRIEIDILKSRLLGALVRDSAGISDRDIDDYLKEHPELNTGSNKIKLSHLMVATNENRDLIQARATAQSIYEKLKEDLSTENFAKMVAEYSDSPNKSEAGSLGTLSEDELSPQIQGAIAQLKAGQISSPIEDENGVQIFMVNERISDQQAKEKNRELVRKILERDKIESKLGSYFTVDLYKLYHVEKKI